SFWRCASLPAGNTSWSNRGRTKAAPVRILGYGFVTRVGLRLVVGAVMNPTSRLFLMGSGFVLAAGLGTGLVAYYNGLPMLALAASASGPDELKYVPQAAAVAA